MSPAWRRSCYECGVRPANNAVKRILDGQVSERWYCLTHFNTAPIWPDRPAAQPDPDGVPDTVRIRCDDLRLILDVFDPDAMARARELLVPPRCDKLVKIDGIGTTTALVMLQCILPAGHSVPHQVEPSLWVDA